MRTEERLRHGLLALAALTAVGTSAELFLANHLESPPQLVPFVVMGLGLLAVVRAWMGPTRVAVRLLQGSAVVLLLAGAFGVFEHLDHNYAFEAEIRPTETFPNLLVHTIFGANPALAPGAVALMGLLSALATVGHPALAPEASHVEHRSRDVP